MDSRPIVRCRYENWRPYFAVGDKPVAYIERTDPWWENLRQLNDAVAGEPLCDCPRCSTTPNAGPSQ